ncbi:D12 class N6 adenine-specific DNA methyltransferase [Halanaeroarchaeum sulfurireducens]|uniref:D12 class N6 adenine-specific DNA methyltransferase n=1 Tax=Halanaeroarchaeum sulfurireducens TaxID=1604004 RepID=A0A0F7P8I0_9EURY|nr:D12 class N6 adenine-specific DNA methyltransferase [Halanaeroarchaeum sulfurireducens]ALG80932.1 D12 class N6 adenine-specific DNA methyltransferase [Halanaeroarchaeum sulfurireducens]
MSENEFTATGGWHAWHGPSSALIEGVPRAEYVQSSLSVSRWQESIRVLDPRIRPRTHDVRRGVRRAIPGRGVRELGPAWRS